MATKIIIPFDTTDLRAGGRSLFVDQRGYVDILRAAGNYSAEKLERDMLVLRLLEYGAEPRSLPAARTSAQQPDRRVALLFRDLRRRPGADAQLRQPGDVAAGRAGRQRRQGPSPTNRLVSAMLSNQIDEKLEPLRLTLGLTGNDFREGVFSWRGFLYYKWSMGKFWPDVMGVLREINAIARTAPVTPEQKSSCRPPAATSSRWCATTASM